MGLRQRLQHPVAAAGFSLLSKRAGMSEVHIIALLITLI